MIRLLFVCTGNICRSPMAESLLKAMLTPGLKGQISVCSAGTHALVGRPAEPNAVRAMRELGIDLTHHRAQEINENLVAVSDVIVVMERFHATWIEEHVAAPAIENVLLLGEFGSDGLVKEIADPYGQFFYAYRACALIMRDCIKSLLVYLENVLRSKRSGHSVAGAGHPEHGR